MVYPNPLYWITPGIAVVCVSEANTGGLNFRVLEQSVANMMPHSKARRKITAMVKLIAVIIFLFVL